MSTGRAGGQWEGTGVVVLPCRDQGELGGCSSGGRTCSSAELCTHSLMLCFTELLTGLTPTELRMDCNNFGSSRLLFLCLPVAFSNVCISTIHSFALTLFRMYSLSAHLESLSSAQWDALKLCCHNGILVAF